MDPLFHERLTKRNTLLQSNIPPYADKYQQTHFSQEIQETAPVQEVEDIQENPQDSFALAGRLMTFREHGRLSFGTLQDAEGRVQICFLRGFTEVMGMQNEEEKTQERFWKKTLDLGDYIGVQGDVFTTKHGEKTLLIHKLTVLTKALRPLPEKWHGIKDAEKCYRERNLDLISNPESLARFRLRGKMVREIRDFFHEKGFEEIETNILQSQAGGAMAKVFETHHNALDHDFVLRIALELPLKMACSGGFDRVFEIGKNFRNEGSDPSHLQEFTMLEWYAAYKGLETNKKWTEALLQRILKTVFKTTTVEIIGQDEEKHRIDFGKPFASARFPDLITEYAGIDMFLISDDDLRKEAESLGVDQVHQKGRAILLDDIYKKTARPQLIQPTFVFDYPQDLKPLARPKGDGTAECFQLLIGGWEVVNSYGELIDPIVQRALFEEQAKAKESGDEEAMSIDEGFLKAMEHGFPPMTGSGIGIDRLLALLTSQSNLRDVVLFPTLKPEGGGKTEKEEKLQTKEGSVDANMNGEKSNREDMIPKDEEQKFVVVLNKKIETGKLMNALGHMAAGITGGNPQNKNFIQYRDSDEGVHPHISHFPFIVLRADNSNKLRTLRKAAQEAGVEYTDFTSTMTLGTSAEQVRRTHTTPEKDLEYYGVCVFGDADVIDPLTKKFSLWR